MRLRTLSVDRPARAEMHVDLANPAGEDVEVAVGLSRDGSAPVRAVVRSTGSSMQVELVVADPVLWSAERPALYDCTVQLSTDGRVCDEHALRVGLRTVEC